MTGSLQPKGKDRWRLVVSTGRDPVSGKYGQKTRTFHGTKTQAKAALAELAAEVRAGRHTGADATLGTLIERWLEMVEHELAPLTVRGYRSKINVHLRPSALWTTPLRKLEPAALDAFYAEKRARGLKVSTVRQIHAVVRRACRQGVVWKWLPVNPATLASPGKAEGQTEYTIPAPADVLRAVAMATESKNPDFAVFLRVDAATGSRRSETCHLQWRHVDLERGKLYFAKATTKTRKGRWVTLDPETVDALRAHRKRLEERAAACELRLGPGAYVFSPDPDGSTPAKPDSMTQAWGRLRDRLGLTGVRLHDWRHFNATQLLAAGVPVKTVSERLGHAQTSTTMNIYAHALEAADQDAAAVIGGLLASPPEVEG